MLAGSMEGPIGNYVQTCILCVILTSTKDDNLTSVCSVTRSTTPMMMTDDHNAMAHEGNDEEQNRAVEVVLVRYVYIGLAGLWLMSPVPILPIRVPPET